MGAAGWLYGGQSSPAAAAVLEWEGRVEVSLADENRWTAVQTNQVLRAGDRLRTGERSRATVRLSDLSTYRLGALSLLQIAPKSNGFTLLRGLLYFFHRDKPGEYEIRTPTAYAVIRGTEFNLEVADDQTTILSLLDGVVELTNAGGGLKLVSGQAAVAAPGQPPTLAILQAVNVIQWCLYYPAVLDASELQLSDDEQRALAASLSAYRSGDVPGALKAYPADRSPASDDERIYYTALLLAVGQAQATEAQLRLLKSTEPDSRIAKLSTALQRLITAVKNPASQTLNSQLSTLNSSTECLAESYALQAQANLKEALAAARRAVERSPKFGFAWARVAELEFGFGRVGPAQAALEQSLTLAPRNAQALAVRGFVAAAKNRIPEALSYFDQAIVADGALGNGWLGRGLCQIRLGRAEAGRQDLQVAATLEPQRALLRSYLGKAFAQAGDPRRARQELELARRLDPADPTAFLYAALLAQQENQVNEAARDLERSAELNDNRRVYRSELLLDQDRAVRSANLAAVYQDAGLEDVGRREAARAVNTDYANYSAHLFLANSYDALRDPRQVNLRYETPWLSEYLVANLLAPAAAGTLSPYISQQEYARLFERDRLGFQSRTEYWSRGDWLQTASQYGIYRNSAYAIDADYRSENGHRSNNDFEQLTLSLKLKQELTPQDSVYFQAIRYEADAGDVNQYYDQRQANSQLRLEEDQEPLLLAGYHHEWSPGVHTLFLGGRLVDTFKVSNPQQSTLLFARDANQNVAGVTPITIGQEYRSDLEIYTAEAQQIWRAGNHAIIAGGRVQAGDFETQNQHTNASFLPFLFQNAPADLDQDFSRYSLYAYEQWQVVSPLMLIAGVSYDRLQFPANYRYAPLSELEQTEDQVSPKAGLIWTPARATTVRAGYARGLGGASFDQSFQLEPTQVAGFNQAFRSVIPESVAGANAAASFEMKSLSLEQKIGAGTYLGLAGEWLESEVDRDVGVFNFTFPSPITASQTREELDYEERSVLFSASQLVGKEWSFGARYRLSEARLRDDFPEVPDSAAMVNGADVHSRVQAVLHQVNLFALYNHPSGFFGQVQGLWNGQSNHGYAGARPGDEFWQFNTFVGYRFPRRRAEVRLGLLNLTAQDYRLNPLNLTSELPRDRTLVASLRFYF